MTQVGKLYSFPTPSPRFNIPFTPPSISLVFNPMRFSLNLSCFSPVSSLSDILSPISLPLLCQLPEPQLFTAEQRQILLKYFDECGMTSTHRRNAELIQRCATDVGTTIERVKVKSVREERDSESEEKRRRGG